MPRPISKGKLLYDAIMTLKEGSCGEIYPADVDDLEYDNKPPYAEVAREVRHLANCNEIRLHIPGEDDYPTYTFDEFIREVGECESLTDGGLCTLRSSRRAWQLVSASSDLAHGVVYHQEPARIRMDSGVEIALTNKSLQIAMLASRVGAYQDDYYGAMKAHHCVEITFPEPSPPRSDESDWSLINSYLFELAATQGIVFVPVAMAPFVDEPPWDVDVLDVEFKFKPVESFNDGMRLFLAAAQVSDVELSFFSYYKVLEHFAPTVLSLEAHEAMRKKLDTPDALKPDGEFIHSLFELCQNFDTQRRNERDMIKSVLLTCVDLVSLARLVPPSLLKPISYETPRKDLETWARDVAESVCSTRNHVAHAKATYEARGTECTGDALAQLTVFLKAAAAATVRWYNRLPDHQKHGQL
jgi:hypothetical protein